MRVNGALTAVREWEDQERLAQDAMRAQNRSELGFRSDGFLEFGVGSLTSLNNFSLDDVFPSQPKRYALSNATHRQKTAKGPRGPTLRGPRTWMRHQNRTPALPEAVEELDRYYTGMQNPIGRSAGAGNWRSNSERVVLAISQPPEIQWNESQAGPEPAKQHNGSLLILKVSSGSVQNWRHVKDAGTGPPPTRHSEGSQPSSSAQQRRRPVDMPMVAGMGSSTAHVIVPKDEACEVPASSPGEEDKASSPKLDVLQRDSTTKESRREGATITFTVASSHPEPTSPRLASAVHKPSEESLHASPTSASHSKRSSARGLLGSRVGQTASSFPGRPLTEATKTWRNTPSWESTGWYSQGSLLDSATDAHVAPALRHGRSQPADCSHRWRPRYGAVISKSFPSRPAPPQVSKLGWSRFPLAGEVDNKTAEMIFYQASAGDRASNRHQTDLRERSRAELMNQTLDRPGGLSRLNPDVPPRLRGGKLTMQRDSVIRFAQETSSMEDNLKAAGH